MTIVQFIKAVSLACTGKIVSFFHGEKWEQNLQDETTLFPLIMLDHPITAKDKILPMGNQETTYSLTVGFFDKSAIDMLQENANPNHQEILDRMYAMKREFITRINNSNFIKKIDNARTTEIINQFDLNVTGVVLQCDVTVVDTTSVCDVLYVTGFDANGNMFYVVNQDGEKIKI